MAFLQSYFRFRRPAPPPVVLAGADGEKRIQHREVLAVEIGLLAENQFYTGFTQNVSSGGLFVSTRELRPIGERFRLLFRIPGCERDFNPLCEVRWHRQPRADEAESVFAGMGVRFLDLTPEEQRLLDAFIDGQETLFFPED